MHPAPSIIFFVSFSGLGFGLLFCLAIAAETRSIVYWVIAIVFAVAGLLFSSFHLGNPKNAYKAFSQWRSSWLSREAIFAVVTLTLACALLIAQWFWQFHSPWLYWLLAVLSVFTVFTTAMIYTQLKTVPRWNHWLTPLLFIQLALAGGSIVIFSTAVSIVLVLIAMAVQLCYWWIGDQQFARRAHTIGTATGLGERGRVRLFEGPHTGSNYLLREMVYVVARKHAMKLRLLGTVFLCVLPIVVLSLSDHVLVSFTATLSYLLGLLIVRWLFFAEAEHVVGLYYDKR